MSDEMFNEVDISALPVLISIEGASFHLKVEPVSFQKYYPSIQTSISIQLDFFSLQNNFLLNNICFGWNEIENYYQSLKHVVEVSSGKAVLKDSSIDNFFLQFSRTEFESQLLFKCKNDYYPYETSFMLKVDVEIDVINVVYRQLSDFVRNIKAIIH